MVSGPQFRANNDSFLIERRKSVLDLGSLLYIILLFLSIPLRERGINKHILKCINFTFSLQSRIIPTVLFYFVGWFAWEKWKIVWQVSSHRTFYSSNIIYHFKILTLAAVCNIFGSHGIEPTRDGTYFLKIEIVVAGDGFYSYYNLQCIKLDKETKNLKKMFYACKKHLRQFLKIGSNPCWIQFHAYHIFTLYICFT